MRQQKVNGRLWNDNRRFGNVLLSPNNRFTLKWMTIMSRQLTSECQPTTDNVNVRFHNGHFKLQFFNRYQTILGFWHTCSDICAVLQREVIPNYSDILHTKSKKSHDSDSEHKK